MSDTPETVPIVNLSVRLDRIGLMACARYARLTGRPFNKTLAAQAAREAVQLEAEIARDGYEQTVERLTAPPPGESSS